MNKGPRFSTAGLSVNLTEKVIWYYDCSFIIRAKTEWAWIVMAKSTLLYRSFLKVQSVFDDSFMDQLIAGSMADDIHAAR
jgi:hypothetical protein